MRLRSGLDVGPKDEGAGEGHAAEDENLSTQAEWGTPQRMRQVTP
jgi:hypothetical protein